MSYVYRPSARIEIAGQSLSSAEAGLRYLAVDLGLGRHGSAQLTLWAGSKFSDVVSGDACTIALGSEGDETQVFCGQVSVRRQQTDGVVIEMLDTSSALSRTRQSITFEESSIDDIVARLTTEVGIGVTSDARETLAIYYVAAHRTLWDHLRDLADLTGRDLSVDASGDLVFLESGSGADHSLRYGAELLDWTIEAGETPRSTTFAAHGTASQSGTWHWIGTDPLGKDPGQARVVGVFSDQSLADTATEASAAYASRASLQGTVFVTGNTALRPADSITISDLPGGDPDPLRIRTVRHRFGGERGFTTVLGVEGGGAGGGLLAQIGGLL